MKGKFFFQIDQEHQGGSTSFFISDISISIINQKNVNNICGYYLYLKNSSFYSGIPFNYQNKKTTLNIIKNEVTIIMDMEKKTLKFIIDKEKKNTDKYAKDIYYENIPIEKPLFPTLLLYDENDSLVFLEQ